MPSQTFMNLDKIKQKKLIDAAMTEFSSNAYPDVSINKIIIAAKIPRGSFYMYFKDKQDLFEYLIKLNHKILNEAIKKTLIENDGNLKNTFVKLYDILIKKIHSKNYEGIFKNIFIFFNIKKDRMKHPGHILFEYIKDYINIENLKIPTNELEFVFNMFMHTLFISITDTIKSNDSKDIKRQYLRKLDIICYGIYKEVN